MEIGSHFRASSDLHGWFVKRLMLPAGFTATLWWWPLGTTVSPEEGSENLNRSTPSPRGQPGMSLLSESHLIHVEHILQVLILFAHVLWKKRKQGHHFLTGALSKPRVNASVPRPCSSQLIKSLPTFSCFWKLPKSPDVGSCLS